jgi:nucleoid DNA-binding protein
MNKSQLIATIASNTGQSSYKAEKALETVLKGVRNALGHGREVDLGKLGRLVVVKRGQKRVIRKNLKGRFPSSIVELYEKHPRSVRLLGGKDMSDDPKPTIVHKKEPEQQVVPARSTHFSVAIPSWRRRFR